MEGTVQEVLPNTQFRVLLANGAEVLAYAGGKMRQRRIRIIAGDRVSLEISPYDVTRGRINYRHQDSAPPASARRRFEYKKSESPRAAGQPARVPGLRADGLVGGDCIDAVLLADRHRYRIGARHGGRAARYLRYVRR